MAFALSFLSNKEPSLSTSAVTSRLVWPMAAVLTLTLGLIITTVFWTSEGANEIAADRQRGQIANALTDEMNGKVGQLASLASSAEIVDLLVDTTSGARVVTIIGTRAARYFGFNGLYALNHDGSLIAGMVDGQPVGEIVGADVPDIITRMRSDLNDRLRAFPNSTDLTIAGVALGPKDLGTARLIQTGPATYLLAAVPVLPADPSQPYALSQVPVLVAYQHVDQPFLDALAARQSIGRIALTQGKIGKALLALPVSSADDRVAAHLVWLPDRPGDLIRERLVPMTLVMVIAVFIFSTIVFAHVQRVAMNLAKSEERAQRLAGHDALSGLPNRLLYGDRLDQELNRMRRGGEGLAVLFLDLDRFKDVNDTYGHEAGDDLIKQVARRLSDLLRGADTLARFGGDEFAIIQTGVRGPRDVEALARRILDCVGLPFEVPGGVVSIGISIGIALAPDNGEERETLMRLADTALYQAKNDGRNRYSFFERQMDEALRLRKIVEDDLRLAITADELTLYYQPLVSADGETIVGLEALVRWPHPRHGLISPGQFISIAEERGLIIPLGDWVLRRACRDAMRWPHLRMAVNVSPIQFRHKDFVASVTRVIEASGIDPTRLEIELTEGVVVADADAAEAAMMDLRALGVRLALDDFGTGYSSLIYLRRFAFDKIKIDRSFLESMEPTGESAILVHSVVHLGRALGLTVTAEGVETKEQHRFLQAVGCHELQGFLFSKPVPAEEIDRMLAARTPALQGPRIAAA